MTIALSIFAGIAIVTARRACESQNPYRLAFWLYLHAVVCIGLWLRLAGVIE